MKTCEIRAEILFFVSNKSSRYKAIRKVEKHPLISIIIPTFNRGDLISETIESILKQSFEKWEAIIVDDGSTDNTKEVIKVFLKDPRIRFVKRPSERSAGGNAARNYGFELSRGAYIKWLDSDDLLVSDCLEKQMKVFEKEQTDVVFCRSRFFNADKEIGEKMLGPFWNEGFIKEGDLLENFVMGQVRFSNNDGLWKRTALPEKPYSENLKNSQEFLMITSMLINEIKVKLIDEVLVLVRTHSNQMPEKRTYAEYSKNQCLARYLLLGELIKRKRKKNKIYKYLLKSMAYYILQQIRKGQYLFLKDNLRLLAKASVLITTNQK